LRSIQAKHQNTAFDDVPGLAAIPQKPSLKSNISKPSLVNVDEGSDDELAGLLDPLSKLSLKKGIENGTMNFEKERAGSGRSRQKPQPTSTMSRITQVAREQTKKTAAPSKNGKAAPKRLNPYILKEAHCEDLNESSGTDEEDEDTDLSGFIVDDDAEVSFHGSAIEISSDECEQETRRRKDRRKKEQPTTIPSPRRRLVRGRRKQISDSEDEDEADSLSKAMDGMKLGEKTLERQKNIERRKTLEVIDLTSSPIPEAASSSTKPIDVESEEELPNPTQPRLDPFSLSKTNLILQPSISKSQPKLIPPKTNLPPTSPIRRQRSPVKERPTTPPATPPQTEPPRPQSPTKLKSPSKHFSPSKRLPLEAPAPKSSLHRQSTDAFWDHNVINEWTDTFSPPKKPVLGSPRRGNPLAQFNLYADDDDSNNNREEEEEDDSFSDSLPSPCESPTKPNSRSPKKQASAHLAEKQRLKSLKDAQKAFDAKKHDLALDLLHALDKHVTSSRLGHLSASTGGVKVIWSKTLRSTAGRASWKRTVTNNKSPFSSSSSSPQKQSSQNSGKDLENSTSREGSGKVVVKHDATIELASKIITNETRLVSTLAHEFCHLANFMVSNIRDNPHGSSFQEWGRKVTTFLKSDAARGVEGWREEWRGVVVETRHGYVVEWKFLWVCKGRKDGMGLDEGQEGENGEEGGCGAEYGRHSRSIDALKQRCGRCRGFLVQVRPVPRGVGGEKSPKKIQIQQARGAERAEGMGLRGLERMIEAVDLRG